jgi:transposase
MAERREEAIQLLQAGEMKQAQIARYLGVSEAAVSKWKKKLEEEGPQSLELRKATGRPPRLDDFDKLWLLVKLENGAAAEGFRVDFWDLEKVNKVIQQEFDISYNKNYIYELLHDLKWKLPRKRGTGFETKFSNNPKKQELRVMYKNNLTQRGKDITIIYDWSMINEIIEVLENYEKNRGQRVDNIYQDEPVWWPKFLPPVVQKLVYPGFVIKKCSIFHCSASGENGKMDIKNKTLS